MPAGSLAWPVRPGVSVCVSWGKQQRVFYSVWSLSAEPCGLCYRFVMLVSMWLRECVHALVPRAARVLGDTAHVCSTMLIGLFVLYCRKHAGLLGVRYCFLNGKLSMSQGTASRRHMQGGCLVALPASDMCAWGGVPSC